MFSLLDSYIITRKIIPASSDSKKTNYGITADQIKNRLVMMGLSTAVINYGFTDLVVPGII